MRKFLSVVAGAVVAVGVMLVLETLGHTVNPTAPRPSGAVDVAAMNAPAKLMVVAGWFLGAFAGAWTALRMSGWPGAAWIVGTLVLLGGIANLVAIPHPFWMQTAALLLPALAVLAALRLHGRGRAVVA